MPHRWQPASRLLGHKLPVLYLQKAAKLPRIHLQPKTKIEDDNSRQIQEKIQTELLHTVSAEDRPTSRGTPSTQLQYRWLIGFFTKDICQQYPILPPGP